MEDNLLNENFFIIDSDNIKDIKSNLYGYCIINEELIFEYSDSLSENIDGTGAYILIENNSNQINIFQDFNGSYGLYLFEDGDYFALSNSFLKLEEFLKEKHDLTLNNKFAKCLLAVDLCSFSHKDTLVNEIKLLPRNLFISIDKDTKKIVFNEYPLNEFTVELNSEEGLKLLDSWHDKWINIFRNIKKCTNNFSVDLTGGFDSRLIFLLILNSNIDLNTIRIHSATDKKHVHEEDYEIASSIAKKYNFKLNQKLNLKKFDYKSVEIPLNNSFYSKLGFHKQMYFENSFYQEPIISVSGAGGGSMRGHPNQNMAKHSQNAVNKAKTYSKDLGAVTEEYILEHVINLQKKFSIQDIDSLDLSQHYYNEGRSRHHFGKQAVEAFLSNKIVLEPLMDPMLRKLKLYDKHCEDRTLLITLIFIRYCPDLITFKVQGNRKFNEKTIDYAKEINQKFSYVPKSLELISQPTENTLSTKNHLDSNIKSSGKSVYTKDINQFLLKVYQSDIFRNIFVNEFSEDLYNIIFKKYIQTDYFPLADIYAAIAVIKIILDLKYNKYKKCKNEFEILKLFITDENATESTIIENEMLTKYIENELLIKYITARIDIKNFGDLSNEIELININDDNSKITSPKWFVDKQGKGMCISSSCCDLSLKIKCIGDGDLKIDLRTLDIRDKNNNRFPVYIDYTYFKVDNTEQLTSNYLVWHDKPFVFNKKVVNDEILDIKIKWSPFSEKSCFIK